MLVPVAAQSAASQTISAPPPLAQRASLAHGAYHANLQTKYHTIAHEMLDDEFGIGVVTPEMYGLLDRIVDWSRAALPARTPAEYRALDAAAALDVLVTIDKILCAHGFVYPAQQMGWVDLLSDGLTPRTFSDAELQLIHATPENQRRAGDIQRLGAGPFYLVDCDIASFLYLAVADELGMPIAMVNLPSHDFIRWNLSDDRYVDFETMYGRQSSDSEYDGFGQTPQSVQAGLFMTAWTAEQTLGYHASILAGEWARLNDGRRERHLGMYAIELYPTFVNAWNAVAWADVMSDDPLVRRSPATLDAARKAVAGFSYANNLDTLACAYAEAGDWDRAAATEREATHAFNSFPGAENFSKYVKDFEGPAPRTCYAARGRRN